MPVEPEAIAERWALDPWLPGTNLVDIIPILKYMSPNGSPVPSSRLRLLWYENMQQ